MYCSEVEEVLYKHAMVLEAAVFGIPDDTWGEAVYAVVVPRGDVTPEELIAHCKQHIGGYKVPKQVELRADPLPKSGPGKVLKRELREPFWAGRETAHQLTNPLMRTVTTVGEDGGPPGRARRARLHLLAAQHRRRSPSSAERRPRDCCRDPRAMPVPNPSR